MKDRVGSAPRFSWRPRAPGSRARLGRPAGAPANALGGSLFLLLILLPLLACTGSGVAPAAVPAAVAPGTELEAGEPGSAVAAPEEAPAGTPNTSSTRKVVVIDPGHGGDEVGAARHGVVEKHSNLEMALRVEAILLERGLEVVLTRRSDARVASPMAGFTATRTDLQARIDIANAAGADVFVSIHSNGSSDESQRGVEVWYDSSRPFGEENHRLADLLLRRVLGELRSYGYAAVDRGLFDGRCFRVRQDRCFTLFVLGGPRQTTRAEVLRRGGDPEALGFGGAEVTLSRATNMPGALVELLIISNAADAGVLRHEEGRDAMARGVAAAVLEFLGIIEGVAVAGR